MRRVALALAMALLLGGCIHAAVPTAARMTETASALDGVLPALAELRVKGFRDQDWCRFIDYPRGTFSNQQDETSACNVFSGTPMPYDDQATADWERVRQALRDAGVSVLMVWNISFDDSGQITQAEFDMNAGAYDRFSYLYDPLNQVDKEPNPDTIVTQQINGSWWFLSEDWN